MNFTARGDSTYYLSSGMICTNLTYGGYITYYYCFYFGERAFITSGFYIGYIGLGYFFYTKLEI